jgi:hypothetical protein
MPRTPLQNKEMFIQKLKATLSGGTLPVSQ